MPSLMPLRRPGAAERLLGTQFQLWPEFLPTYQAFAVRGLAARLRAGGGGVTATGGTGFRRVRLPTFGTP